jgi:diguanylate cyclase (GGDEF)-like protein/PAS domain S-box-containing protein
MAGPLPTAQRVAVRLASFGIAAVLLALAACAAWGATSTYLADHAVKRATEASNAIERVRQGIAAERLVRRSAGPTPTDDDRSRHKEASAVIQSNLLTAHIFTEGMDRRLVEGLSARHNAYLAAAGNAWGEESDESLPLRVFDPTHGNSARADAALSTLEADADQLADRLRVQALGLLQVLVDIQTRVLIAGPVLFTLGLVLVGTVWRMQRSEQRRGTTRLVEDAYAANWEERRYRGVVDSAPDPILFCAGPGNVIYHNSAARAAWSYDPAQLDGQSILMLAHPDDRAALRVFWEQLRPAGTIPATEATMRMELRLRDGLGQWLRVELVATNLLDDMSVQAVVLTVRSIENRPDIAQRQADLALLDPLTRLPNALLLRDRLGQAMARAARGTETVGLLLVCLDRLPKAEDSMVLEAATRIQASVRPQDTVARLDGSTFAIVRELSGDDADAVLVAESIAEVVAAQFSRPLESQLGQVVLQPRIGVVVSAPRRDTVDGLLRNAGLAMHQVTPGALKRYAVFQTAAQSAVLDRVELEGDLRGAVQRLLRDVAEPAEADMTGDAHSPGELQVYFQPIVQLSSGKTCGFEALVRWHHPLHGLVPSRELIPMAEESGLIVPLGQWVLEEACRQVMQWQERFRLDQPLTLGVNLSSQQFRRQGLVLDVNRALLDSGLDAACLRLEVTEATIMHDADQAVRTLWNLKELGVDLAIDDFGAGYSALPYLKQLPIGLLKIDGGFVAGIGLDQEATSTVRAVVSLAKSLGWGVTAEGIETAAQAQLLGNWGCDFGQGYYFGRPLDAEEAADYLAATIQRSEAVVSRLAPA